MWIFLLAAVICYVANAVEIEDITVSLCGTGAFICSSSTFPQQPLVPGCVVSSGGFCCCNWNYYPSTNCGCVSTQPSPVASSTLAPSISPSANAPTSNPSPKIPTTKPVSSSPSIKPRSAGPTSRTPTFKPSSRLPTLRPTSYSPTISTRKPSQAPTFKSTRNPTVSSTKFSSKIPTKPPSNSPTIATLQPAPSPVSTPVVTTGTIIFHYLYGSGYDPSTGESLNLQGDAYTDLIMSNIIAGVLLGHLIRKNLPSATFDEDYLYGSIFGQLLQENLATEYYNQQQPGANAPLLDPSPLQSAVFGVGQGGPYQINNYAVDLVVGTFSPGGFSLINYNTLQKNIGYTFASAASQNALSTPASFNNLYYGPVLPTYFHFNDFMALQYIGGTDVNHPWSPTSFGWTPAWQPNFYNCLKVLSSLPGAPLDIILNIAYNAGYYSALFVGSVAKCATTTAANIDANFNSFTNSAGSSYNQYPYQVRGYVDQLYGRATPSPANVNTILPPNGNHVAFNLNKLSNIFANVFGTLGYVNPSTGTYGLIPTATASSAFSSALSTVGLSTANTLDLCVTADRAVIFTILKTAIKSLEQLLGGVDFTAKSNTQL